MPIFKSSLELYYNLFNGDRTITALGPTPVSRQSEFMVHGVQARCKGATHFFLKLQRRSGLVRQHSHVEDQTCHYKFGGVGASQSVQGVLHSRTVARLRMLPFTRRDFVDYRGLSL